MADRTEALWLEIQKISSGDALILLALERESERVGARTFEPAEVAAVTGQSRSRVEAGLRRLADRGLVERDYRLGEKPPSGPPPVRVVYRAAELETTEETS